MTLLAPPLINARGHPWTSRGRRNLTCAGTGLGNGGVTAPGKYQRRRDCIGPDERHDGFWRRDWRLLLAYARQHDLISSNAYEVGHHLVDVSDDKAHHAYPSQSFLGSRMDRSTSTAHRALAELRAVGLLEWNHRFEGPAHDNPRPHPTSNLYEFVIPNQLAKEAGLTKRLQRLRGHQRRRTERHSAGRRTPQRAVPMTPAERERRERQRQAESHVHGAALVADATFEGVVAEIEATYAGDVDLINFALDILGTVWQRRGP